MHTFQNFIKFVKITFLFVSTVLLTLIICCGIFFYSLHHLLISDEDTELKSLVQSWLSKQPEETRSNLHSWIEDYFYQALEWVMKQGDFVVDTSLVGVVMNGLSHLGGAECKADFAIKLIRGLGGNLSDGTRANFAKEVS